MEKDYCVFAANWWATKIKTSEHVGNIDLFEKLLYNKIKSATSLKASLLISTYKSRNNMLDEISYISGVSANIPSGYEMRILFDHVWVYNEHGMLVSSF